MSVSIISRAWRCYQEIGQLEGQQHSSRTTTSAFLQEGTGEALLVPFKMTFSRPQLGVCLLLKRSKTDSKRVVLGPNIPSWGLSSLLSTLKLDWHSPYCTPERKGGHLSSVFSNAGHIQSTSLTLCQEQQGMRLNCLQWGFILQTLDSLSRVLTNRPLLFCPELPTMPLMPELFPDESRFNLDKHDRRVDVRICCEECYLQHHWHDQFDGGSVMEGMYLEGCAYLYWFDNRILMLLDIGLKSLVRLPEPTQVQWALGSSWSTTMPDLIWLEYAGSSETDQINWPHVHLT